VAVVVGEAAVRIRPEVDAGKFRDEVEGPVGKALEGAGESGALGFATKFAGAFGGALAIGDAFSTALDQAALGDRLSASLGLTTERSAEVGQVAGNLYAHAYGDSLETVNGAVAAVMGSIGGMSDASSADLEAVTGTALNFATAMDVDVASAAKSAGILVKTGLADSATDAFDLLTVAAQEAGPAMVEPVLDAANEYSTNFAAMGYSGEQAMALLVDASAGGEIAVDKVGDAVKEFSIRSTDMSATSVAAYQTLGLNAEDMANRILAGGDSAQTATQQIIAGLQGIQDPATRANTAIALFGSPLEDLGVTQIPAFLDSLSMANGELEGTAGAAAKMGDTLNDNASSNLTSFMRTAQQVFVDVLGGQVIPKVQEFASWIATNLGPAVSSVAGTLNDTLGPAVSAVFGFLSEHTTTVQVLAGVIGGVLVAALGVWAVQSTVAAAANVAAWFAVAVSSTAGGAAAERSALQVVIGWVAAAAAAVVNAAIVVGGWVLMGAQAMLQAARMAAAWFIALGPVGWVIAAIIGLVALVIANWETVKNWTIAAWNAVVGAVVSAWQWVSNAVSAGVSWVVGFVSGLPGMLLGALASLGALLGGLFSSAWQWAAGAVSAGIGNVLSFVGSLPGRILGALSGLGSLLVGLGGDLIRGLVNGISGAASFVGDVAGNIWRAIRGFINSNVIDRLNGLLEFTIAGVHVNPPDIPRLHSGGVFDSGEGEGLALLRDDELVATPEQRRVADDLLRGLLAGDLPTGRRPATGTAAAGVSITKQITQLPGEDGAVLAARVTQGTVWNLNSGITRTVGATA
jgi:phage-related minor tail protein